MRITNASFSVDLLLIDVPFVVIGQPQPKKRKVRP